MKRNRIGSWFLAGPAQVCAVLIAPWPASAEEPKPRATIPGNHFVLAVAFSPDGKTLASGAYYDETVRLWDVATGTVKLWDVDQRKELASFPGDVFGPGLQRRRQDPGRGGRGRHDEVLGHGDGQGVASPQAPFEAERAATFSPDGRTLAVLAADTTLTGYGKAWRKKVAAILGQSESTLTKCLQFFPTMNAHRRRISPNPSPATVRKVTEVVPPHMVQKLGP